MYCFNLFGQTSYLLIRFVHLFILSQITIHVLVCLYFFVFFFVENNHTKKEKVLYTCIKKIYVQHIHTVLMYTVYTELQIIMGQFILYWNMLPLKDKSNYKCYCWIKLVEKLPEVNIFMVLLNFNPNNCEANN